MVGVVSVMCRRFDQTVLQCACGQPLNSPKDLCVLAGHLNALLDPTLAADIIAFYQKSIGTTPTISTTTTPNATPTPTTANLTHLQRPKDDQDKDVGCQYEWDVGQGKQSCCQQQDRPAPQLVTGWAPQEGT
jgi:hypothetical protein